MRQDRPYRILCLLPSSIGDAVLTTGILSHFREQHRPVAFTIVTSPLVAPLFRAFPDVERVIPIEKRRDHLHWVALWTRVWRMRWNVVVDMRGTGISYLLWTGRRIINRSAPKGSAPIHRVVKAASLIGRALDPPGPFLVETDAAMLAAKRRLGAPPVVAIAPGGSWAGKFWPGERFAAFAAEVLGPAGLFPDGRLLVLGGRQERSLVDPIFNILSPGRVIDGLGLDLLETFSCLKQVRLFVGNDSGMMHLAAAAGTPTLGLFGPTSHRIFSPWGASCLVVRGPDAYRRFIEKNPIGDDVACRMDDIGVDDVLAFGRVLLASQAGGVPFSASTSPAR